MIISGKSHYDGRPPGFGPLHHEAVPFQTHSSDVALPYQTIVFHLDLKLPKIVYGGLNGLDVAKNEAHRTLGHYDRIKRFCI